MTSQVLVRCALVAFTAALLAGCGARSINDVLANPAQYTNREITVRGTVAESATVLGRGAFRIVDDGQGLWVVTTSGAPRTGARVNVTGRLQDGYDLSGFGRVLKLPESLQSGLVLIASSVDAR
jgi:hypothetical protein